MTTKRLVVTGLRTWFTDAVELAHHGITVVDLEASSAFFADVLGFVPSPRIDLDEEFSAGVTGVQGARISVVFLDGPDFAVELLQYDGPPDRGTGGSRPCDAGAAHLALYVDDVVDVVRRAEPHGWCPAGAVQPITTGPRQGGLAVYLRDEVGAVVELVQRPAAPEERKH